MPPNNNNCGGLYVTLRPDKTEYEKLWAMVKEGGNAFSRSSGWHDAGLVVWPTPGDAPPCDDYCGGYCRANAFWCNRCRKHRVMNWVFASAECDQGWLWWAYNVSGISSYRDLFVYGDEEMPHPIINYEHYGGLTKPWTGSCKAEDMHPELNPGVSACGVGPENFWRAWLRDDPAELPDGGEESRKSASLATECPSVSAVYEAYHKGISVRCGEGGDAVGTPLCHPWIRSGEEEK